MSITAEAQQEVEQLLNQGRKDQAVRYLCEKFNVSPDEATLLVDAVESGRQRRTQSATALNGALKDDVIRLLTAGKKIEAVKLVKSTLQSGLKEALVMVEEVEAIVNPNYKAYRLDTGCFGTVFSVLMWVFGIIGGAFLLIAGIMYTFQAQTAADAVPIAGNVVALREDEGMGTAPVIEFTLNGEKRTYESNVFSSPPAYSIGETVPLLVSNKDPGSVLIDTFTDRWLFIVVFGSIGTFFGLFAIIFRFRSRRF